MLINIKVNDNFVNLLIDILKKLTEDKKKIDFTFFNEDDWPLQEIKRLKCIQSIISNPIHVNKGVDTIMLTEEEFNLIYSGDHILQNINKYR